MASPPSASPRWLFGPVPDLLLGCGVLYAALFALFSTAGGWVREVSPLWLAPLLILVFSVPHYGATLLRVYERRSDRRAYFYFSVYATLGVLACFGVGLYRVDVGSALLTLYITWSPWHYTGQNYGLAVMFLRRRGLPASGATKRWLHASFVSSYALTFATMHSSPLWADVRGLSLDGDTVHFVTLGLPGALLVPVAAAAWTFTTGVVLARLLRRARVVELLPTLALVLTQALWFSLPYAAGYWRLFPGVGPLDANLLGAFLVWIAVGHAVQYLWVTSYYARSSSGWAGLRRYLGKTLAAGALVWTLPFLLLTQTSRGAAGQQASLGLLVAAAINVHHFILDGAIWKLRSSRIAKILVRSESAGAPEPPSASWLRPCVWAVAGLCTLVAVYGFALSSFVLPAALEGRDPARAERVLDQLAVVALDSPEARRQVGVMLGVQRRYGAAMQQAERSLALRPTPAAYALKANLHAEQGQTLRAVRAAEDGIALARRDPAYLAWAGDFYEKLGRRARARELREARRRVLARAAALERGAVPLTPGTRPRF